MSKPEVVSDHTGAFYGAAVAFLMVTGVWNAANIMLSGLAVQAQWNMAMGVVSTMFAVVVVSKVIRDRQESQKLVNGIRQARYEEMLAHAPAPGLGQL